jgi:hypothetical protein
MRCTGDVAEDDGIVVGRFRRFCRGSSLSTATAAPAISLGEHEAQGERKALATQMRCSRIKVKASFPAGVAAPRLLRHARR